MAYERDTWTKIEGFTYKKIQLDRTYIEIQYKTDDQNDILLIIRDSSFPLEKAIKIHPRLLDFVSTRRFNIHYDLPFLIYATVYLNYLISNDQDVKSFIATIMQTAKSKSSYTVNSNKAMVIEYLESADIDPREINLQEFYLPLV